MGTMTVVSACSHVVALPDNDYYQHFIGRGVDSWLLCGACSTAVRAGDALDLLPLTEPMVRQVRASGFCDGITGAPSITERAGTPLAPILEASLHGPRVLALAAMPDRTLLAYSELQDLEVLGDTDEPGAIRRRFVAHVELPDEFHEQPFRNQVAPRLIVDPTGRFAVLLHDYGRFGAVVDLRSGKVTMALDGGDYYPETVPLSACFITHRGAPVLLHRTEWNRLEASDPETGRLLTPRPKPIVERGKPRPEHYHDYFHGSLLPSPSGSAVLDDGWVWQPFGNLMVFDAEAWLERNPWETEDGASLKSLVMREDWDAGLAWITDDLVALGHLFDPGHAGDDLGFLYRISTRELTPIAGPSGRFFSDGVRLFTAGTTGLSVWNIKDGTRAGFLDRFAPTLQHRARGELIQADGNRLLTWRYDVGEVHV